MRCNHKSSNERSSFYRFPSDVTQRRLWVRAVKGHLASNIADDPTRPSGDALLEEMDPSKK